ncbi:DUF7003 family protein [Spirosoma litoris]
MLQSHYTDSDILVALDEADKHDTYNNFLDLEHPYVYTAGSAMNLFADSTRWAIVFEKSGFSPRGGYPGIDLYYFGNCLHNLDKQGAYNQFTSNMKLLPLIAPELMEDITEENDLIKRSISHLTIRENSVSISQNPDAYEKRGISISTFENPKRLIDYCSLIRYLADTQPESLRATSSELRTCLPQDLPCIMSIDQWHHKSYSAEYNYGVKPSEYETYRMVAQILATQDPTRWKPTLEPNNDWRNWPEAGSL